MLPWDWPQGATRLHLEHLQTNRQSCIRKNKKKEEQWMGLDSLLLCTK